MAAQQGIGAAAAGFSSTSKCSSSTIGPNNPLVEGRPAASRYQYAVVEHGEAYFDNMEGRHGKQLSLAYNCVDTKKRDRYLPDDLLDLFENDDDDESSSSQVELGEHVVGASTKTWKTTDQENVSNIYEETSEDELEDYQTNVDDHIHPQPRYNNDGSVIYDDPSELLAYKAGAPAGGIFAIIQLAGASQHKVAVDDVVIVNKLLPLSKWKVGETVTLQGENEVLLIGSQERTVVGLSPGIPNATVQVMVEEITHDATIIVFKKKRRKNYRRKKGFRREVTMLRVLNIEMPPELMHTTSTATTTSFSTVKFSNNSEGNQQTKSSYSAWMKLWPRVWRKKINPFIKAVNKRKLQLTVG